MCMYVSVGLNMRTECDNSCTIMSKFNISKWYTYIVESNNNSNYISFVIGSYISNLFMLF